MIQNNTKRDELVAKLSALHETIVSKIENSLRDNKNSTLNIKMSFINNELKINIQEENPEYLTVIGNTTDDLLAGYTEQFTKTFHQRNKEKIGEDK
jgi:hypothetical protein